MLIEERRLIVYHGRVRLDSASVSSFALWVRAVLSGEHKPKHEFRLVSAIPGKVMQFHSVAELNPASSDISISDVLVRHSARDSKAGKGAALSQADIETLPLKLETANWYFDKVKKNPRVRQLIVGY